MTTAFIWTIPQLDCYPQAEGQTDVVFNIHWRCTGTDGTYNGSVYGTCGVTYEAGTPFTPFAQLTQDQVLGWAWANGVNKTSVEATIQAQIDQQATPPVVSPKLPWSN
jgi:hypothetical protein